MSDLPPSEGDEVGEFEKNMDGGDRHCLSPILPIINVTKQNWVLQVVFLVVLGL